MEAGQPDRDARDTAISEGTVKLFRDHTGREPTNARTTVIDDLVTVVMTDTLTNTEQRLVDAGATKRVLDLRWAFQQKMRDELVALVEDQVDRKVIAFMSANHLDPDMASETFILAPA